MCIMVLAMVLAAAVNYTLQPHNCTDFGTLLPESLATELDGVLTRVVGHLGGGCIELQAARDGGRSAAALAALPAAAATAAAALALARRPFKYVTNWCFSSKGTETLVHLVRGWGESMPTKAILGDDIKAMYQHVSRKASFDFIRKRFPELLAVYRFFYRVPRRHLLLHCPGRRPLYPQQRGVPGIPALPRHHLSTHYTT